MMTPPKSALPWTLLLGDGLAILAVTLLGFAAHQLALNNLRWLTTFLPLCVAWALLAPWLGCYRAEVFSDPLHFWRAGLAMILAAPLAALLRGLWLNTPVLPVFVGVLGGSAALGISLWRGLWAWVTKRTGTHG